MVSLSLLQMERSGSSTRWGGGREVRFQQLTSLVGQRPEKQGFSWLVCAGNSGWFPTSFFTVCVDQIVCRECSRPCNDIHVLSFLVKTMQIKFLHYSESCPLCAASQSGLFFPPHRTTHSTSPSPSMISKRGWGAPPFISLIAQMQVLCMRWLPHMCHWHIIHSG